MLNLARKAHEKAMKKVAVAEKVLEKASALAAKTGLRVHALAEKELAKSVKANKAMLSAASGE